MTSWSPAPHPAPAERPSQPRIRSGVEAAFRDALVESFEGLALSDRNLIRLHHCHRRGVDQLAEMLSIQPAAVVRQLARLRDRLLREVGRGLAARLPLDRDALDRLLDVVDSRLDIALARVLRS